MRQRIRDTERETETGGVGVPPWTEPHPGWGLWLMNVSPTDLSRATRSTDSERRGLAMEAHVIGVSF